MSKFTAPNLDQLIEEWNVDSVVDTTDAGGSMIKIPVLHSKYNKYLSLHKLASVRKTQALDKLTKTKWQWINGKLDQKELTELGWEPFLALILKPDQAMWMNADADIQELKASIAFSEECVSFCTFVMKELNSRTYQIREWMAWTRFENGAR